MRRLARPLAHAWRAGCIALAALLLPSLGCPPVVGDVDDDDDSVQTGGLLIEDAGWTIEAGAVDTSGGCDDDGANACNDAGVQAVAVEPGSGATTAVAIESEPHPHVAGRVQVDFARDAGATAILQASLATTHDSFPFAGFSGGDLRVRLSVTQLGDAVPIALQGSLVVTTGQAPNEAVVATLPLADGTALFAVPTNGVHVRYRLQNLVATAQPEDAEAFATTLLVAWTVENADASCRFDADCPAEASFCVDGACLGGGLGDECRNPFDCGESLICATDTCSDRSVGSPCETDAECELGCASYNDRCTDGANNAYCDDAGDCLDESQCIAISYLKVCSDGALYAPCLDDADCDAPLLCTSSGYCFPE